MNDIANLPVVGGEDISLAITDVKHYTISLDSDGNEVRTECEAPVYVQTEGEVATEYVTA